MFQTSNIYLTLVVIGITILTIKFIYPFETKEHFGNPLALAKKIGMGMVNFFINFIDILLVIADFFMAIPVLFMMLMDLIVLLFTWLHPISMIKGVVTSIFVMTKIILLMVFDIVAHILRMFFAKIFGFLRGGLWGLPHTPEQHHSHVDIDTGWANRFMDHHHDGNDLVRPLIFL